MDSQNDHIDDNTRDNILNNPELNKKCDKYIKYRSDEQKSEDWVEDWAKVKEKLNALHNANISNKKEETNMADENKTTVNSSDYTHLADILWDESTKHPLVTIGLISVALILGGTKLTEHIISRGVYIGNMRTLKTIYRMTR